jgi:hypothetical protein
MKSAPSLCTYVKLGARDYLQKPFEVDALLTFVRRALEHNQLRSQRHYLMSESSAEFNQYGIVGRSRAMQDVIERAEMVAQTKSTVLIVGASGPQPHPGFIEVFCEAAICGGEREVAGAGENGPVMTAKLLGASIRDAESQLVPYLGEAEGDIGKPLATTQDSWADSETVTASLVGEMATG